MAKMVLKSSYLALGGTDWSSRCSKIELKAEVEEKDVTTFASLGWMEYLGGMFKAGLSVGFKQDYADDGLDEVMWTAFLTATPVTFEVRATSAAVGVSNPKYTGSVLIKEWSPVSGSVGDTAEQDVSWTVSGAVTRATS